MSKRSRFMFGPMRRIFPASDDHMSARIGRLCVLYEDLRIELLGVQATEIPELDVVSAELRTHYFLRRSIPSCGKDQGVSEINTRTCEEWFACLACGLGFETTLRRFGVQSLSTPVALNPESITGY
jgi:hypothetical protein